MKKAFVIIILLSFGAITLEARKNCIQFNILEEAQKWFEDKTSDWKRMGDNYDGIACQLLR